MNDIDADTIYSVVRALIGAVDPVGESHTDSERFENLKKLTVLTDMLLTDIDAVIPNKNRQEYSMKKAGEFASGFFDQIGIVE